jgi:hypothetical protein
MNERFQKLAEQARVECFKMGSKPGVTMGYDELEKFAELIVKECMEWCDAYATIDGTAQQVRDAIKKDFGVEE